MAKSWRQVYAVYGGKNSDTYLTQGTIEEIAEYLGVNERTAYFYTSKEWRKRKHQLEIVKMEGVKDYGSNRRRNKSY